MMETIVAWTTNKLLLAAVALIVAGAVTYTPALTEELKRKKSAAPRSTDTRPVSKKSAAARTALCRADCRPNNYSPSGIGIHGIYRSYAEFDPHLTSIEGRRQFAECVKKCVDPLPDLYVQRPLFAMGINWFGNTKESCLNCHAKGH
jgi:hypothetical protein